MSLDWSAHAPALDWPAQQGLEIAGGLTGHFQRLCQVWVVQRCPAGQRVQQSRQGAVCWVCRWFQLTEFHKISRQAFWSLQLCPMISDQAQMVSCEQCHLPSVQAGHEQSGCSISPASFGLGVVAQIHENLLDSSARARTVWLVIGFWFFSPEVFGLGCCLRLVWVRS